MKKLNIFTMGLTSGILLGILSLGYLIDTKFKEELRENYGLCPEGYVRILERAGPPYCIQESGVLSWSKDK